MSDEFSLEAVRQFMIESGGKVTNNQLVTRFKSFLNDPASKGTNRDQFKQFVNTLASVKLDEKNEKILVLKKKYRTGSQNKSTASDEGNKEADESASARVRPPSPESQGSSHSGSISREASQDRLSLSDRTSSQDRLSSASDRTASPERGTRGVPEVMVETPERSMVSQEDADKDEKLSMSAMSVRERAKQLNKMQSETDLEKSLIKTVAGINDASRSGGQGYDDDDSQSGTSVTLDQTEREWMIQSSSAEYQSLVKLLRTSPTLAHRKDFTSGFTALHWACKHGKIEVVKLLCGTHKVSANTRTHGGYTPLHMAAMHGHEDIIELLVQAYDADPNIRDFSGKKAKQYLRNSASTRAQQLLQPRRLSTNIAKKKRDISISSPIEASPVFLEDARKRREISISSPIETSPVFLEDAHQPFRRVGSYSAKIQRSGYLGIVAGSAVRSSWATSDRDSSSERDKSSPSPTPPASPGRGRRGSINERRSTSSQKDSDKMPPPKSGPIRRRWTKKNKENEPRIDETDAQREGDEVFDL